MLKLLAIGSLGFALVCGAAGLASAKTIVSPHPHSRYLPHGEMDNYAAGGLLEGRSIYKMEDRSTFYGGSDERGYMSGDPQNPRTGN
jgi:hypothetical protein